MGNGVEVESQLQVIEAYLNQGQTYIGDVRWLIAELRAALAARDAAEERTKAEFLRAVRIEADLTAARAALQKYGRHNPWGDDACELATDDNGNYIIDGPSNNGRRCTCGLDKALTSPGDAPNGGVNA